MASPTAAKIALFRSLFRGREDVLPRRWENPKTGKSGFAPMCRNEWVRGVCGKPQVKCGECPNQAFVPAGDEIFHWHLAGRTAGGSADFTLGVYPMLPDETCWFLAADFDKRSWLQDVAAFRDTARAKGVPIAIERSRSGNGAHAWIFFAEPVAGSYNNSQHDFAAHGLTFGSMWASTLPEIVFGYGRPENRHISGLNHEHAHEPRM